MVIGDGDEKDDGRAGKGDREGEREKVELETTGPSDRGGDGTVALVEVLAGGGIRVVAEGVRHALNRREIPPDWERDPLVVRVLGVASVDDARLAIRLDVENVSPHGVYVEGVRVSAPKASGISVRTLRVNGTIFSPGMGATPKEPPAALPVRLHRDGHLALLVTIPHPSSATLKKARTGKLMVEFSAVGVPDAKGPLEVPFLIRADANGSILPPAGADIDVG